MSCAVKKKATLLLKMPELKKLFQFLTGVARVAQGVFNHPRAQVPGFDTQYLILVVQVYIPSYNSLEVIKVRTNVIDVLPVAQIGFKNEDVHI